MILTLWDPASKSDGTTTIASRSAAGLLGVTAFSLGALFGAGTAAPLTQSSRAVTVGPDWTSPPTTRRMSGPLSTATASIIVRTQAVERRPTTDESTLAQEVRQLHGRSGLTWDQLARLFGVSRRAVHNWAAGGRLSAANAEFLSRLSQVIADRGDSEADETRAWLLTSIDGGVSRFDMLRQSRSRTEIVEDLIELRERLGISEV